MLPEFDLLLPRTLPEALAMLAERVPDVLPIAGGTNLIPDMRGGRCRPAALLNVSGLPELCTVRREDGWLLIGSGVTVADLLDDPQVTQVAPVLQDAARTLASPLVRNRATVAGNLANASPAADMAPPLLALDAEVTLASRVGSRQVPLKDFFVHVRQTVRRPDELITAIRVPLPPAASFARFFKMALRNADAIAVVNGAVRVDRDEAGRCQTARIALGAVAPTPIRVPAAEAVLEGQRLTPEIVARAARLAAETARPIDDLRGSADYRRRVTEALVRRALTEDGMRNTE